MATTFSDLPFETYYYIGLNLSYKELIQSCSVSKDFASLCANQLFWKYKSMHDFNISAKEYAYANKGMTDDRETYIKLAGLRNIPIPGAEKYGRITTLMHNALSAGEYELFWTFFEMQPHAEIFQQAGKYGLKELIDAAAKKYVGAKLSILSNALYGQQKVD